MKTFLFPFCFFEAVEKKKQQLKVAEGTKKSISQSSWVENVKKMKAAAQLTTSLC